MYMKECTTFVLFHKFKAIEIKVHSKKTQSVLIRWDEWDKI